jgi:hypothetical protein
LQCKHLKEHLGWIGQPAARKQIQEKQSVHAGSNQQPKPSGKKTEEEETWGEVLEEKDQPKSDLQTG